nr:hypothetical protein [Tanacetum cinerariifolium]
MMCQPIAQNVDFSGSDQIQNPQYPLSQENPLTNDKFEAYTNANDDNMNDLQTKLDNFQKNQQDFQKKFEQKQDDFQNQMRNFMQSFHDRPPIPPPGVDKEHVATTDTELPSTKDIQPLPKQSMEDTMLELVKICQAKEFLCIHDDVDDLIESALNSKLLLINSNSQRLDKKHQEVKMLQSSQLNVEIIKIKGNDFPISEKSPVCDNHSDTFSDSKIDDDISVYDDDFEDIEYVEASLSDLEIVSVEEENVVQQEEKENDIPDNSSNNSLLEEVDLFLFDNSIPLGIENFADDPGGGIRFMDELLIDDSIISQESSNSNFKDSPLIPRPPLKPPDAETNAGEEIPVVMNDKDEDVDKKFSLLSAESEDTIFHLGIYD